MAVVLRCISYALMYVPCTVVLVGITSIEGVCCEDATGEGVCGEDTPRVCVVKMPLGSVW